MMERQSSPAWSTALELNDGEGAGPLGRGAALGSGEALGPTYSESGGVRWLDTDEVVENRGEHGGDGLSEADTAPVQTRCSGWPPFIAMYCVEAMWAAPGERKGGDGSARWQSEHARAAQRQWEPHEGHASCVCPYVDVEVVSWIGGDPGVHAVR
jgi:hypothetical protein